MKIIKNKLLIISIILLYIILYAIWSLAAILVFSNGIWIFVVTFLGARLLLLDFHNRFSIFTSKDK